MKHTSKAGARHCADVVGTFYGEDLRRTRQEQPKTAGDAGIASAARHEYRTGKYLNIVLATFKLYEIARFA